MRPAVTPLFVGLAVASGAALWWNPAAGQTSSRSTWARVWQVPTNQSDDSANVDLPEDTLADVRWRAPESVGGPKPGTLGIAFSGGGTRAATATVGQLQGLEANGWLSQVTHMAAVSGGSWAAVPVVYSRKPMTSLVGDVVPPRYVTPVFVRATPQSELLQAVVTSGLAASGAAEAFEFFLRSRLGDRRIFDVELQRIADFVLGNRRSSDQTFADMLGRIFIAPFVDRPGRRYSWNDATVAEILARNGQFSTADFITATPGRPFLVVGGTVLFAHPALPHTRVMPIELTPMYTGLRQRFGGRMGGHYVWPHWYDVESADALDAGGQYVRVAPKPPERIFTLADVIGVSGSAPLLGLFGGAAGQLVAQHAPRFFPVFNHFAIRDGRPAPTVTGVSHGDGGFTDNTGVMPLLARKVEKLIVFVNGASSAADNIGLESLFHSIDRFDAFGGNRARNVVFDLGRWLKVKAALDPKDGNGSNVYCDVGWKVHGNPFYNIAPYDGLEICFVNNQMVNDWKAALHEDTRALFPDDSGKIKDPQDKKLNRFPWFRTFEENAPRLIKLDPIQVNLLAHLASWTLTNKTNHDEIRDKLGLH